MWDSQKPGYICNPPFWLLPADHQERYFKYWTSYKKHECRVSVCRVRGLWLKDHSQWMQCGHVHPGGSGESTWWCPWGHSTNVHQEHSPEGSQMGLSSVATISCRSYRDASENVGPDPSQGTQDPQTPGTTPWLTWAHTLSVLATIWWKEEVCTLLVPAEA